MNTSWLSCRRTLAASVLILAACAVGCGSSNPYPVGSYERAVDFRDRGKHQQAADAYGLFLRRSPTDSLAAQAQFDKARSYMEIKEYPLAAVEYQILRQEYPTSELLEEAMFQECESYLLQVGRAERDMTPGFEARDRYLSFLRTYPMSPFRPTVEERLVQISDMVVVKQLKTVDLYRRLKKHESAAIVLDRLIESERKTRLRDRLFWERYRTAIRLEETPVAIEQLEHLIAECPGSSYLNQAQKQLTRLQPSGGA